LFATPRLTKTGSNLKFRCESSSENEEEKASSVMQNKTLCRFYPTSSKYEKSKSTFFTPKKPPLKVSLSHQPSTPGPIHVPIDCGVYIPKAVELDSDKFTTISAMKDLHAMRDMKKVNKNKIQLRPLELHHKKSVPQIPLFDLSKLDKKPKHIVIS
jgi:hypothetical protein